MDNKDLKYDDFKPEVEFGLVREYDMSASLKVEIPFDHYRSSDYCPMTDYIDSKVHDFIESTHDEHRRHGYFTAPFLVRCVLRGHDDNSLFVSPPKLMTAGLLPPCLGFYDFPDCNRLGLYFRLTGTPVFSLMIRIGGLPDELASKVKCVDIHVTRQIPAFSYGGGHRCSYSDVLRSMDTGSPLYDGVDLDDLMLMFKGRYSDSEWLPEFKRHYTDAKLAQTPVWYVSPNNMLPDMLVAETGFHRVSSIEAGDIIGLRSFRKIRVHSTTDEWIEYHETLEEEPQIKSENKPQIKVKQKARVQEPSSGKPKRQLSHNSPAHPRRSISGMHNICNISGRHNISWMCKRSGMHNMSWMRKMSGMHNMPWMCKRSGINNMSWMRSMLGIYRVAALCGASAIPRPQAPTEISSHPPAARKSILPISSGLSPPK